MMNPVIWLLVAFFSIDSAELFGKDNLPRSELPLARPELIEAFQSLLHKALDSEGTYHRDLLIAADIVQAPPGYESPKDVGSGKPQEIPFSPEMKEYFNMHITDILTSIEKLDYALNRLFGERILQSYFMDPKDSWHPKRLEYLKFYQSRNQEPASDSSSNVPNGIYSMPEQDFTEIDCNAEVNSRSAVCKDSLPEIPELPSLPSADFVMTSQSEFASENELVTSASIVDTIATEYIKVFSATPESSTLPSNLQEASISEQGDVVSLTALDDAFIMYLLSSSNELSSSSDESKANFEKETEDSTEFLSTTDAFTDSSEPEAPETESDSMHASPKHKRVVLTVEEVQLLDKSLTLKPELKYHVISTFRPDLNPLPDVYFSNVENSSPIDETSSSKSTGKKRRRINPRGISLDEPIFYQAPTPHKMLLRYYRDIPDTSFTCENKSLPGFYADQETDCQVFHVCWPGRRESFLCPVGSLFNQRVLSCDNFNNTNCSLSHVYFDVNSAFQEYDDAQAHNVTPMPDPMMKPLQNDSGTTAIVTNKADIVELFEADLHFSDMVNKTNITELWEYLPVKAKVFVYPEPADLKTFLAQHHRHHHHHKVRKSKDVRGLESTTETEDFEAGEPYDILEKRQRIEANIVRVLKKLSRKHRN